MGRLNLPAGARIYIDSNIVIYSVDRHPAYINLCDQLWLEAQNGIVEVVSSDLTLLETLVGPLRNGDISLSTRRSNLWSRHNSSLIPITRDILREAARLRAVTTGLKTPDAIHAATALLLGCGLFVSNDIGFKRILGLPLVVLDDVLAAP